MSCRAKLWCRMYVFDPTLACEWAASTPCVGPHLCVVVVVLVVVVITYAMPSAGSQRQLEVQLSAGGVPVQDICKAMRVSDF